MACAVYCLVASHAEVDPLVHRLQEAGVRNRDISIVHRGDAELVQRPLPLVSSALWWPLFAYAELWTASARRQPVVIPLSHYLEKRP